MTTYTYYQWRSNASPKDHVHEKRFNTLEEAIVDAELWLVQTQPNVTSVEILSLVCVVHKRPIETYTESVWEKAPGDIAWDDPRLKDPDHEINAMNAKEF